MSFRVEDVVVRFQQMITRIWKELVIAASQFQPRFDGHKTLMRTRRWVLPVHVRAALGTDPATSGATPLFVQLGTVAQTKNLEAVSNNRGQLNRLPSDSSVSPEN
jgi:hypothetical protein